MIGKRVICSLEGSELVMVEDSATPDLEEWCDLGRIVTQAELEQLIRKAVEMARATTQVPACPESDTEYYAMPDYLPDDIVKELMK